MTYDYKILIKAINSWQQVSVASVGGELSHRYPSASTRGNYRMEMEDSVGSDTKSELNMDALPRIALHELRILLFSGLGVRALLPLSDVHKPPLLDIFAVESTAQPMRNNALFVYYLV